MEDGIKESISMDMINEHGLWSVGVCQCPKNAVLAQCPYMVSCGSANSNTVLVCVLTLSVKLSL